MKYSDNIIQAFSDWINKKAYINNRGSYCARPYPATPSHRPKGEVAVWNKEVRKLFKDSLDFHKAARNYFGMDELGNKTSQ